MGNAFYGQIFSDNDAFKYILSFKSFQITNSCICIDQTLGRIQSPVYIELYAYSAP